MLPLYSLTVILSQGDENIVQCLDSEKKVIEGWVPIVPDIVTAVPNAVPSGGMLYFKCLSGTVLKYHMQTPYCCFFLLNPIFQCALSREERYASFLLYVFVHMHTYICTPWSTPVFSSHHWRTCRISNNQSLTTTFPVVKVTSDQYTRKQQF